MDEHGHHDFGFVFEVAWEVVNKGKNFSYFNQKVFYKIFEYFFLVDH